MSATSAMSLLFVFLLLITAAQGVRLDKESRAALQFEKPTEATEDRRSLVLETATAGEVAASSGRTPRPIAGDGGKMTAKALAKDSSSTSSTPPAAMQHEKLKTEKYPDLVDLAGMDYSPAIRKPPIHN